MNEFDIIDTFFKPQRGPWGDVVLGIGDDAAQIAAVNEDRTLATEIITLAGNQYFYPAVSNTKLLHSALAVKIEALREHKITPRWMTLALTLPEQNRIWLQAFSQDLLQITTTHHIQIIGGDTTHGPFALTVHLLGYTG